MLKKYLGLLRCPKNGDALTVENGGSDNTSDPTPKWLVSTSGARYPIRDGVPDLTYPPQLGDNDNHSRESYDAMAGEVYDNMVEWIFDVFGEDEYKLRSQIIDRLELNPTSRVLEVGCGTGADTLLLHERLTEGTLFSLDLSMSMVRTCRDQLVETTSSSNCATELFCANGSYLPFADGCFDAVLHVGGINEFTEKERALTEMARVTRVDGKVVVVDESMAPWLKGTEYARILTHSNPLFAHSPPITQLPMNATEVQLGWVLGNAYYLIDFRIAAELPALDLDLPHKGRRGGTLRTRWFGQLEGVTLETKALAEQAVGKLNISMHQWLDNLVREQATQIVGSHKEKDTDNKVGGLDG